MELNPEQFFHGSRGDIANGTTLVPSGASGRSNWEGHREEHHARSAVFSSNNEGEAWHYALHASDPDDNHTMAGRPAVYRVNPSADVKPGAYGDEHMSSSAKVVDRVDTFPNHQGTLPINWRQFAKTNQRSDEWNYPSHKDVALGHTTNGHMSTHRPMTDGPEPPMSLESIEASPPLVAKKPTHEQKALF